MPTLRDLFSSPVTLASMGQHYADYPAGDTFDDRFGFWKQAPQGMLGRPAWTFNPDMTAEDLERLRQLYLMQQQPRRDPNTIIPGTKSWPFGFTQT